MKGDSTNNNFEVCDLDSFMKSDLPLL